MSSTIELSTSSSHTARTRTCSTSTTSTSSSTVYVLEPSVALFASSASSYAWKPTSSTFETLRSFKHTSVPTSAY